MNAFENIEELEASGKPISEGWLGFGDANVKFNLVKAIKTFFNPNGDDAMWKMFAESSLDKEGGSG